MAVPFTLILVSTAISFAPSTLAVPIDRIFPPGTSKARKIGIYVASGAAIIIFAGICFYIGLRRGRTGTWLFWRRTPSISRRDTNTTIPASYPAPPEILSSDDDYEKQLQQQRQQLLTHTHPDVRHSRPLCRHHRTAPAELYHQDGRLLELPVEATIHEIGQRSSRGSPARERRSGRSLGILEMDTRPITPRKYRPESSVLSRDKSQETSVMMRDKRRDASVLTRDKPRETSVITRETSIIARERPRDPSVVPRSSPLGVGRRRQEDDAASASGRSVATGTPGGGEEGMDWEGFEWLRRMYRGRGNMYRISWRPETRSENRDSVHSPST